MPRDRAELLRCAVALCVLLGFSLAGLMARFSDDHRRSAVPTLHPTNSVLHIVARQP